MLRDEFFLSRGQEKERDREVRKLITCKMLRTRDQEAFSLYSLSFLKLAHLFSRSVPTPIQECFHCPGLQALGTFWVMVVNRSMLVGIAVVLGQSAQKPESSPREVVTTPRHKGHDNILPKRQFTHVRWWSISNNITSLNLVAHLDHRFLIDTGVLVWTGEFVRL